MQTKKKYRINESIIAQKVRLIDQNSKMIGIIEVKQALETAKNIGLDLVEIFPNSNPPVCKILDYSKQKYNAKKKASEAKRKQKVLTIKEIKIGPNIEYNDYKTKLRHTRKFIINGHKIKVTMKFKGRELTNTDVGLQKLEQLIKDTNDIAKIEFLPKREGNQYILSLIPKNNKTHY